MDISFRSRKMMKIFNSEKELVKEYGKEMAGKIIKRMVVLRSAENLDAVPPSPPPRRHELFNDWKEHFAVDLVHPHRLIFKPNASPIPRKKDGGIDLFQVTSIEIVAIKDYH